MNVECFVRFYPQLESTILE